MESNSFKEMHTQPARERELVSQPQLHFSSCLTWPNDHQPAQAEIRTLFLAVKKRKPAINEVNDWDLGVSNGSFILPVSNPPAVVIITRSRYRP